MVHAASSFGNLSVKASFTPPSALFADGFESADTTAWSTVVPLARKRSSADHQQGAKPAATLFAPRLPAAAAALASAPIPRAGENPAWRRTERSKALPGKVESVTSRSVPASCRADRFDQSGAEGRGGRELDVRPSLRDEAARRAPSPARSRPADRRHRPPPKAGPISKPCEAPRSASPIAARPRRAPAPPHIRGTFAPPPARSPGSAGRSAALASRTEPRGSQNQTILRAGYRPGRSRGCRRGGRRAGRAGG